MTDADGDYRYPVSLCWHCDQPLDTASNMPGQEGGPEFGAVSLCMYCGAVGIFAEELALRPPTKEELEDLEKDKEFLRTYSQFGWARQYLMIQQRLLRRGEDPDR